VAREKSFERSIIVPAGCARAFEVPRGGVFYVTDIEGGQIADLVAYNAADTAERMSASHTRLGLMSVRFRVGDSLRSNLRRLMLKITEDTVGTHDMMVPPCDRHRYLVDYGVEEHANCVDAFEKELAPWGITSRDIVDTLNIFENAKIDEEGNLIHLPTLSKAGDHIAFEALMDLVCAVSSCPMDLNATGGNKITDIGVEVTAL